VSGCATAGLSVLLHNTTIGPNVVIRNAIIDPGFDFPCAEHDAAAGPIDVLQGCMPGRQAEEFIHLGHCPSRAELVRPGNAIVRPGGKACKNA